MGMVWKLEAVIFSASNETKFEFDTTSIISPHGKINETIFLAPLAEYFKRQWN